MNGDEFDAAICAITGVVDREKRLEGDDLSREVLKKIQSRVGAHHRDRVPTAVPDNYMLMSSCPNMEIRTVRKPVNGPDDVLEAT